MIKHKQNLESDANSVIPNNNTRNEDTTKNFIDSSPENFNQGPEICPINGKADSIRCCFRIFLFHAVCNNVKHVIDLHKIKLFQSLSTLRMS